MLLLAVLPVALVLNFLRNPARRPRALLAALVIAWIVHLPSDAILVYSAWFDAKIGTYADAFPFGAGPLIRLLALIAAVGLTLQGPVTEAGNRKAAGE